MKHILSLVFLAFITTNCGSINNNNSVESVNSIYTKVAEDEFNGLISYISNKAGTSIICTGNKTKLNPTFSFFVFSNDKQLKVTETYNNVEEVEWIDNKTIKYKYLSGIVNTQGEGQEYIFVTLNNK